MVVIMIKYILLFNFLLSSSYADESTFVSYEEAPAEADKCTRVKTDGVDPHLNTLALDALDISDNVRRGKSCTFYDDFIAEGVPVPALKQALKYFENNKNDFSNKNYITIADYSQNSSIKRFFLLDLRTGGVVKEKVSHGSGSLKGVKYADATIKNGRVTKASSHNGNLKRCRIPKEKVANKHDQWALTRPGFFKTRNFYMSSSHDERVKGQRGWPSFKVDGRTFNGMRLEGLTRGVNDKALSQGVVMHEAYYNRGSVMGRSFGCPAFVPSKGRELMKKIVNGSLYYSYVPVAGCSEDHRKVLKTVSGWETMCN